MPKAKNPKVDEAEALYRKGEKLVDIAAQLDVPEGTVRRWKSTYGWDKNTERSDKNNERSHRKKERRAAAEDIGQLIENQELTDKQKMFCLYYVKSFNATKAYRKAYGVDEYSAMAAASRLMSKDYIKAEICRLKQAKMCREMLSEEDIFQKYMDIAFSDITDYVDFGQEIVPVMGAFGPIQVTDQDTGEKVTLQKRVNAVRFKESYEVDGTLIQEVGQGKDGAKIKLMDKQKALSWIADHMDFATAEQAAKIENLKAGTAKLKGEDPSDSIPNDGFMEALNGSAADDWGDPDEG